MGTFILHADNPIPCVNQKPRRGICNQNLPRGWENKHLIPWSAPPLLRRGGVGHTIDRCIIIYEHWHSQLRTVLVAYICIQAIHATKSLLCPTLPMVVCGDYEIGVVMKVDCRCRRKLDKLTCPYYPTNMEGWGITVIAAWVKLHDCYYELKGSEPQWANSLHCMCLLHGVWGLLICLLHAICTGQRVTKLPAFIPAILATGHVL